MIIIIYYKYGKIYNWCIKNRTCYYFFIEFYIKNKKKYLEFLNNVNINHKDQKICLEDKFFEDLLVSKVSINLHLTCFYSINSCFWEVFINKNHIIKTRGLWR